MTKIESNNKILLIVQKGKRTYKSDKKVFKHLFSFGFIR